MNIYMAILKAGKQVERTTSISRVNPRDKLEFSYRPRKAFIH